MEYDEYKKTFDRDGFVVLRQFLPPDELQLLVDNLDRYFREVVPNLPDEDAFYQDRSRPETLKQMQHMGKDLFFHEYRMHPYWVDQSSGHLEHAGWQGHIGPRPCLAKSQTPSAFRNRARGRPKRRSHRGPQPCSSTET